MQKFIYSLLALRDLLEAVNRRYLEFLSTLEDPFTDVVAIARFAFKPGMKFGCNGVLLDGVNGCAGQVAVDGGQIRLAFENDIGGILVLV